MARRTHIVLPEALVSEIDAVVGKRGRSGFLVRAAAQELKRLRMLQTLESAAGSWRDEDHPELEQGAAKWIENFRRENERRTGQ